MPSPPPPQALLPSLLDRLIDPDSSGTAWRSGYGWEQMFEAVQRDLEYLLNTRRPFLSVGETFPECQTSVLSYGLPDFSSLDTGTALSRTRLASLVSQIIEQHEPRLKDVHVTVLDSLNTTSPHLRFHVDGRLRVDPSPEVSFETVLELMTGRARIQRSENVT